MKVRSLNHLIAEIKKDEQSLEKLKNDPLNFLENDVEVEHPMMNKIVFLIIVSIVTGICTACLWVALKIVLASQNPGSAEIPEFIVGIVGTCLGAIVGLLSPSPISQVEG